MLIVAVMGKHREPRPMGACRAPVLPMASAVEASKLPTVRGRGSSPDAERRHVLPTMTARLTLLIGLLLPPRAWPRRRKCGLR
jgi:hypothetical protein